MNFSTSASFLISLHTPQRSLVLIIILVKSSAKSKHCSYLCAAPIVWSTCFQGLPACPDICATCLFQRGNRWRGNPLHHSCNLTLGAAFFIAKKKKTLITCIDVRGWKNITTKNKYPFPFYALQNYKWTSTAAPFPSPFRLSAQVSSLTTPFYRLEVNYLNRFLVLLAFSP